MKPPPPMLPAAGCTTASARPVATAASTAFPPALSTAAPTSLASAFADTTMPCVPRTGSTAVCTGVGGGAGACSTRCGAHAVATLSAAHPATISRFIVSISLSTRTRFGFTAADPGSPPQVAEHVRTGDQPFDRELLVFGAARPGPEALGQVELVEPRQPAVRAQQKCHHFRAHLAEQPRPRAHVRQQLTRLDM